MLADIYEWKDEEIMVLKDDDPTSPLYPVRQTVVSIRSQNTPVPSSDRSVGTSVYPRTQRARGRQVVYPL